MDKDQLIAFLRNEMAWLINSATDLQRTLEQPLDQPLRLLNEHAKGLMTELKDLRAKVDKHVGR